MIKTFNVATRQRRLEREFKKSQKNKKIFNISGKTLVYFILISWAIISIIPFVWSLIAPFNSFTDLKGVGLNPLPDSGRWTTENYSLIFTDDQISSYFGTWLKNSLIYSTIAPTLNVFFNFLAGYALARIHFGGRKLFTWYLIAGMTIPAQVIQVPVLIILIQLGFIGSSVPIGIWFMGILFTGMTSATWVFMVRQFYINMGTSSEEAGTLDGLSTFGVFWKISLKMMIPLLATQWAMIFIGSWNNYIMFTLWASGDVDRMTVVSGLQRIAGQFEDPDRATPVMLAAANFSILPVIVVYFGSLYFQKKSMVEGEK